jgi:hypothetical protein
MDQQRIAEFIQVIQQMVLERTFHLTPDVTFDEPVTTVALGAGPGKGSLTEALVRRAQQVFTRHEARALA